MLTDRRALLQGMLTGSAVLLSEGLLRAALALAPTDEGTSQRVRINGAQIHYREWGDPKAPPLVLLHPAPFNSHVWVALAPALARRYHVVAPDARGFGDSDPVGNDTNDIYLADLRALFAALNITRPVLVGNSMGATLAFMYAGFYPADVARLILLDTGPGPKPGSSPPAAGRPPGPVPIPPGPFKDPAAAAAASAAAVPPFMAVAYAREMSEHNLRRTPEGTWVWKFDREGSLAAGAQAAADPRKWPAWEAVQCPTLVLRGERGPALSAEVAQQMVAGRTNMELEVIPGAGHFIPLDAPEALEAAIAKWLQL